MSRNPADSRQSQHRETLIDVDDDRWPRVRVTLTDPRNPWPLILSFAHTGSEPTFIGFEVLAEQHDGGIGENAGLDPASFKRLARTLPMYVDYARGEIQWQYGDRAQALTALREAGRGRRGLPDRFYREVAADYIQRIGEGDPHPIKSIAEARPADKSQASRWVKEARERGYIPEA